MLTYDQIKELARSYKARSTDFYCLSPGNDPYYMRDNPHARVQGEWFADLYQQYWHTLTDPLVRSLHYALLHHEVYFPGKEKTRYINLDTHYAKLSDSAKIARYLGMVPMDVIEERRNKPDDFMPSFVPHPELDVKTVYWTSVEMEDFPRLPSYSLSKFPDNQRYHIEIWCEKAYSSLRMLAQRYGAVWQQSQGEQTVECAHMLTKRRKQYQKPVRVFYISDFDPAGTSMPVAVARKLEYLLDDIRGHIDEPDVRLYNLVLTQEQVEQYHLPRTPLKATERRRDTWEAIHGKDAVELNAIEAQPQYKGELVRIVEDAIKRYYDNDLSNRAWLAGATLKEQLEGVQQDIYAQYSRLERLRKEYDDIVSDVSPRLEALNEEIASIWEQISDDLDNCKPDLEAYLSENPLPEAREAEEIDDPLYDSQRDYFSQLAVYKQHQGKRVVF